MSSWLFKSIRTTSQSPMYSWLFGRIFNNNPDSKVQLVIQQYIELQAISSWLFDSILNNEPDSNVQLVIHQFIELPTRAYCTDGYSAVFSITSQIPMSSRLFNSIMIYQPQPNIQLIIRQYIQ